MTWPSKNSACLKASWEAIKPSNHAGYRPANTHFSPTRLHGEPFSLSREGREKVEADVTAQAIARFRARADVVAKQFGFAGYGVREVAVSSDSGSMQPQPLMRAQAMRSGADEALPVEAGKATVTATVSGSVQLK